MADVREPLSTQRCLLRGGGFDGQLRLVAAGPTPTLTVRHEFDGQWWSETYEHDGVSVGVTTFGMVRGLVFRERCPVGSDGGSTREREG